MKGVDSPLFVYTLIVLYLMANDMDFDKKFAKTESELTEHDNDNVT